jgi:hypothetical protein
LAIHPTPSFIGAALDGRLGAKAEARDFATELPLSADFGPSEGYCCAAYFLLSGHSPTLTGSIAENGVKETAGRPEYDRAA